MLRALFLLIFFLSTLHAEEMQEKTYFSYTPEEIAFIAKFTPDLTITKESLEKWDQILAKYMMDNAQDPGDAMRTYTYLYAAQREFALLSYQINKEYRGGLDLLGFSMIRYLHPTFYPTVTVNGDFFSLALTSLIMRKFQDRIRREQLKEKEVNYFLKNKHKSGQYDISFGKNILSWIPWKVPPFITGTIPAPPSEAIQRKELALTKESYTKASLEQIKEAKYWADYDQIGEGNWIALTNTFLFSHSVPLGQMLNIRALLGMAIYDTLIVAFEAKYNFLNTPPYLVDPTIIPYVTYYKHPSYPSAAAMVAETVSSIMIHFFPADRDQWKELAEEASNWGLWAGTSYPSDISAGKQAGQTISQYLLK